MTMRQQFGDLLTIDGVKGLLLLSFGGDIIFQDFNDLSANVENRDWRLLVESLANINEADLVFAKGRLYIRRTELGFLMVLMGSFVPITMIRLQCDILLPSLKPAKAVKGIRRFFKK